MSGYPGVPTLDSIEGIVVHSDIPRAGEFTCSNQLINRIQRMIVWSVRDNFQSVPGSCCNRGERAGWGGDVQVMVPSTYYNFQMACLYTKFLEDYREDQNAQGGVHDSIPWTGWGGYSAPGWHDCFTILAWTMYQNYGDLDILRKHYADLKLALNYILADNPNLIWENNVGGNHISHNHPFLGSVSEWFYKVLAGIDVDPQGPGYKRVTIKPQVVGDLTWVKANHESIHGTIASDWQRQENRFSLKVTLPGNTTAKVHLPKLGWKNVTVTESGAPIWEGGSYSGGVAGITSGSDSSDSVALETGSGSYTFEIGEGRTLAAD